MNNVSIENAPDESILAEERKRERNWDPAKRWRAIQDTIAWADLQAQHPRNSSHACLRAQGFQTQ